MYDGKEDHPWSIFVCTTFHVNPFMHDFYLIVLCPFSFLHCPLDSFIIVICYCWTTVHMGELRMRTDNTNEDELNLFTTEYSFI